MKISGILAIFLVSFFAIVDQGQSCTTFSLFQNSQEVVGHTLDWYVDTGMMTINPRNVKKTALLLKPTKSQTLKWVSRYGSITFSQAGREFPYDGMNEKGLIIENMWLQSSKYPSDKDLIPVVNESQWIQYLLDSAANVNEAIGLAEAVRIQKDFAPMHYLMCDSSGACATFEYIAGELVIHAGANLPVKALTNDTYQDSLKALSKYQGFGGTRTIPTGSDSIPRFVRAADEIKNFSASNSDAHAYAFQALENVTAPDTMWHIVYDTKAKTIYFRTRSQANIKEISLKQKSFSCSSPTLVYDMSRNDLGDITPELEKYSDTLNANIINQSTFLPTDLRKLLAAYPSQYTHCLN